MHSDLYELSAEFNINQLWNLSQKKQSVNSRLFQSPYFVDFESIDNFLDLESEKHPSNNLIGSPQQNQSDNNLNFIDLESDDNKQISGLQKKQRISPPSQASSLSTNISNQSHRNHTPHSMNNMPGFLISAIHSKVVLLKFSQIELLNLNNLNQVSNCFYRLIDVVRNIRTKVGSRKHLRMVFNKLDSDQVKKMYKRMNLVKAEELYLDIVQTYTNQILNEAKITLRKLLAQAMTPNWIHECSLKRKFTDSQKIQTFEKYLTYFRKQLQEGNIKQLVNRKEVLQMDPFQQ